jgi:hypothetical protein
MRRNVVMVGSMVPFYNSAVDELYHVWVEVIMWYYGSASYPYFDEKGVTGNACMVCTSKANCV